MIRKLVAKGFLKEVGRSDVVGRPILYKTTSEFLDYFGLATICLLYTSYKNGGKYGSIYSKTW